MKETLRKTREYLDYVERHYNNVQKAWEELNQKCKGKGFQWYSDDYIWWSINYNIKNHDLSKLGIEEFVQYRQYFYPTKNETKNKKFFESAWDNHLEKNPHHWQNWTNIENKTEQYIYFIENICDWMAMSYEFGDTAKDYYENNKQKINLPNWAIEEMYKIFEFLYE